MKAKTVTRFVLAALTVLVVSSYSSPVRALGGSDVVYYFYTGCDANLTYVGYRELTCDSQVLRSGQQGGWFMEMYETDCDTSNQIHTTWEYCSGAWRASNLGDCTCSH
ncbi:MAG TPA: hypothetical protein VJZ76_13330 [Thermoanaerobaculia bacterium]|nr:hypothetical protein [Thermoanaerobaculia bacterium]